MSKIYLEVQGDKMNGDIIRKGQGGQKFARVDIYDALKRRMACVIVSYDAEDGMGAYQIEFTDTESGRGASMSLRVGEEELCAFCHKPVVFVTDNEGDRYCEHCEMYENKKGNRQKGECPNCDEDIHGHCTPQCRCHCNG